MYTLRKLWSRFWRQTNTHKLNSISRYGVYPVLNFPSQDVHSQICEMGNSLFHSRMHGCMHVLIDISADIPADKSGALRFFCRQILGIAIEDISSKSIASSQHVPRPENLNQSRD